MCGIKRLMLFESKQSSTSTTSIYLTNKLDLVLNYLFGRKVRPQKTGQMQVLSLWKKYNVHVGSLGSFVKLKINKLGFTQSEYFPQLIASWQIRLLHLTTGLNNGWRNSHFNVIPLIPVWWHNDCVLQNAVPQLSQGPQNFIVNTGRKTCRLHDFHILYCTR